MEELFKQLQNLYEGIEDTAIQLRDLLTQEINKLPASELIFNEYYTRPVTRLYKNDSDTYITEICWIKGARVIDNSLFILYSVDKENLRLININDLHLMDVITCFNVIYQHLG